MYKVYLNNDNDDECNQLTSFIMIIPSIANKRSSRVLLTTSMTF